MNLSKERPIYGSRYWTDCSQFILLPTVNHINSKEFNIPNADGNNNVSNASWLCYRFVLMVPLGDKIERKSQILYTLLLL
jgi:hypothetical protein